MDLVNSFEQAAGTVARAGAHAVGATLDAVGLHGAAQSVDDWGDLTGAELGALVPESELGETDDPRQLVQGDAAATEKTADHLRRFAAAFGETADGLSRMDTGHWQGQAADSFRAKLPAHADKWQRAAEACAEAARALDSLAHTITWAQDQARQAADAYRRGQQSTESARNQHNRAVDGYNRAVSAGHPTPAGGKPGPFSDPGSADREHAQQVLAEARRQRNSVGQEVAAALRKATELAPAEPDFLHRLGADAADTFVDGAVEYVHFNAGAVKAAAGLVDFANTLNPLTPYNLTHIPQYLTNLNSIANGLWQGAHHPTALLKSVVGNGWGTDPSEAAGALTFNLASAAMTGGSAEGGAIAADVAENAAKDAAVNGLRTGAEDAALDAVKPGAENGLSAAEHELSGLSPNLDAAATALDGVQPAADGSMSEAERLLEEARPDLGAGAAPTPAPPADPLAAAVDRNVDLAAITDNPVWRDTDEALHRFDDRSPEEIIRDQGLRPQKINSTDLRTYVEDNEESSFLGTTRDAALGKTRFVRAYWYEIDAPGGIDVNATLQDNIHAMEQEVAFPGGVKLEHIKSWRAWDPLRQEYGPPIRNPHYRPAPPPG